MWELLLRWWEWRQALPADGVYMGIAPVVAAALITGGAGLLGGLLNRPSGAEQQAVANQGRAASAEADLLGQRRDLIADLIGRINNTQGPVFQFPDAAGGPANDRAFLESLGPTADLNALMQLAGMGSGTSTINSAAALGQQSSQNREGQVGDLLSNLVFSLLNRRSGSGGSAGMAGGQGLLRPGLSGPVNPFTDFGQGPTLGGG